MSNAYWTGVLLSQLVGSLSAQPEATAIIFRSADNYYESFPLDVALAPGVLLAHRMNGAPLPDKHGFPLRLILPGRYGVKNPKWITRIEFYQAAQPIEGYKRGRRGAARRREALLQDIDICARCGAHMQLQYSGSSGEFPVYNLLPGWIEEQPAALPAGT